jgi:transcriptional regulator with GAF, ATPase, and Fis domain
VCTADDVCHMYEVREPHALGTAVYLGVVKMGMKTLGAGVSVLPPVAGRIQAAEFVGQSGAFQSIVETIETIAFRKSSVIISGETGTGKEMVARQIHARSRQAKQRFVPVDCTALNGNILESQLFGHLKGSFTGAITDTVGFFRAADGGTIFLDEIGELEIELQAILLRVLQESSVTPVGATKSYPIDVRVICATNRDLKQMIRDGTFRADLYFRLNIVTLEVPPLRDRREDVPMLCKHYLEKQATLYNESVKTLSPETVRILKNYDWPGNVRELANVIEHAHISSRTNTIEPSELPSDVLTGDIVLAMQRDEFLSFEQLEIQLVTRALQKASGHKMAAARLLKMDHRKLGRLVEKFDIQHSWR